MTKKLLRAKRVLVGVLAAGMVFQAATCQPTPQDANQLIQLGIDLGLQQLALTVSDTVAFLLDNLFVRILR